MGEGVGINSRTAERDRYLAEQQVYPHLSHVELRNLSEGARQEVMRSVASLVSPPKVPKSEVASRS
jgi:hypothetical protein